VTEPQPVQPAPHKRSSKPVIPHPPRWYQRLAARLIWASIRLVTATLRYSYEDRAGVANGSINGPAIYCVWHNRLALSMQVYFGFVQRHIPKAGLAAMVSASKDGGFLTAILECFGVQPVRGSSSRRGPQALLELTTWAERGYDLAITPDGPRGPRYVVQEGVTSLAQITGLPIIAASCNLGWKLTIKSWDGFQIPLPFGRCQVILASPVHVPREASSQDRELLRAQLEKTLREIARD
jgi:lysophospholipid acyltransferase (LPLAT)-like uncharacterized protein